MKCRKKCRRRSRGNRSRMFREKRSRTRRKKRIRKGGVDGLEATAGRGGEIGGVEERGVGRPREVVGGLEGTEARRVGGTVGGGVARRAVRASVVDVAWADEGEGW